jgi:hypothetical protein
MASVTAPGARPTRAHRHCLWIALALVTGAPACGRTQLDSGAASEPSPKAKVLVEDAGADVVASPDAPPDLGTRDAGADVVARADAPADFDARDAGADMVARADAAGDLGEADAHDGSTAEVRPDAEADVCASAAGALLDQEAVGPTDLGGSINDAFRFAGQTYTAGVTGELAAVSIDLSASAGAVPARVAVRRVVGGVPVGEILGQVIIPSGEATLSELKGLSAPVPQMAGQQYAITVDYPTAPPPGPDADQGTWGGSAEDVYPGGHSVASVDGTVWISQDAYDMHFSTFVRACAPAR